MSNKSTQPKPSKENLAEFRIFGVNPKLKEDVKNIAKYYDMDTSSFIKLLLKKTVDAFPEHIKNWDND